MEDDCNSSCIAGARRGRRPDSAKVTGVFSTPGFTNFGSSTLKLIGVTGAALSGKSTAAQYFVEEHRFVELAFAAPIKAAIQAMLDVTDIQLRECKEDVVAPLDRSLRYLLQTLGTEWGRELVDEQIWIKLLAQDYDFWRGNKASLKPEGIIISDVRFENEAKWVRGHGGIVLHLHRKDSDTVEAHSTEDGVARKGQDYIIHNDFDLSYLRTELKRLADWDWAKL